MLGIVSSKLPGGLESFVYSLLGGARSQAVPHGDELFDQGFQLTLELVHGQVPLAQYESLDVVEDYRLVACRMLHIDGVPVTTIEPGVGCDVNFLTVQLTRQVIADVKR